MKVFLILWGYYCVWLILLIPAMARFIPNFEGVVPGPVYYWAAIPVAAICGGITWIAHGGADV